MADAKRLEAYGRKVAQLRRQQSGAPVILEQLAEVMKGLHAHQEAIKELPIGALADTLASLYSVINDNLGQAATTAQVDQARQVVTDSLESVGQSIADVMAELAALQNAMRASLNVITDAVNKPEPEPLELDKVTTELQAALAGVESRVINHIDLMDLSPDLPPMRISVIDRDEDVDISAVKTEPLKH